MVDSDKKGGNGIGESGAKAGEGEGGPRRTISSGIGVGTGKLVLVN